MSYKERIEELCSMSDDEVVSMLIDRNLAFRLNGNSVTGIDILAVFHGYIRGKEFYESKSSYCEDPCEVAEALKSEGVPSENIKQVSNNGNVRIIVSMPNQECWIEKNVLSYIMITQFSPLYSPWYFSVMHYQADEIAKLIIIADRVFPLVSKKMEVIRRRRAIRCEIAKIGKIAASAQMPSVLESAGYEKFVINYGYERMHLLVEVSSKRRVNFFVRYENYQEVSQKILSTLDAIRDAEALFDGTLLVEGIPKGNKCRPKDWE